MIMNWEDIKELNKEKIETLSKVWNQFHERFEKMSGIEIDKLSVKDQIYKDVNSLFPNLFPGGGGELKFFIKNYQEDWYLKRLFCPTCGKPIRWKKSKAYPGACSISCAASNPEVQAKKEATERKLNNGLRYIDTEDFKQKQKQGLLKLYGVDTIEEAYSLHGKYMYKVNKDNPNYINPMKIEQIKNKSLETRKKLRPDDPTNHAKSAKTIAAKHNGDENFYATKARDVFRSTTGLTSPFQLPDFKEKALETMLKKFNRTNYFAGEEGIKAVQDANLKKYGRFSSQQLSIKNFELLNEDYVKEHFIKDELFLVENFMNFYDVSKCTALEYKKKFDINQANKQRKCVMQQELYSELTKFTNESILMNNRQILPNGLELDIYCPSKKIAIEFNGLYYHSFDENTYDIEYEQYRHLMKTIFCEQLGIHLYQITEDEWLDMHSRAAWLNVLNHSFSNISNTINLIGLQEFNDEKAKIIFNKFNPLLDNFEFHLKYEYMVLINKDGFICGIQYTNSENEMNIVNITFNPEYDVTQCFNLLKFYCTQKKKVISIELDRRLFTKLDFFEFKEGIPRLYLVDCSKHTKRMTNDHNDQDGSEYRKMYDCGVLYS